MNKGKQTEIIQMALGEASALFMSQGDIRAGDIVMPSDELIKITNRTVNELNPDSEPL